jgi:hypothetical protein
MASTTSTTPSTSYGSISSDDVETAKLVAGTSGTKKQEQESSTYNLSFPFQLLGGVVWFSFSLWGVWIAAFYGSSGLTDWNKMNIIFPDMYSPAYPTASIGIGIHLIGAAYMAMAGAFQLVKYIRKHYPAFHRWVGRGYILASMIASLGALTFIFTKGDYGGRPADYAFATYGITFFISGVMTYYFARQRNWTNHRLWAWRLYSLSLAAWIYRFDYHYWLAFFGDGDFDGGMTWLHGEDFQGVYDLFINWAFWYVFERAMHMLYYDVYPCSINVCAFTCSLSNPCIHYFLPPLLKSVKRISGSPG